MKLHYLDNAATTAVLPAAAQAAGIAMTTVFGNPSSLHRAGQQARELLAALQKVVVPIYCTSFLAVEEDKQQKIARVRGTARRGGAGTETGTGGVCARLPLTSLSLLHVQLLQLWEKNGYFDDSIIQQLQSPALGLGQYQVGAAP